MVGVVTDGEQATGSEATADWTTPDYGDFPLKHYLGMQVSGEEPGLGFAQLVLGPDHLNPNGVAHGAVLFALVDTAMGKATMNGIEPGRFCASIEVSLRFTRPSAAGELTATAAVVKRGRSVVHLEARVVGDHERLVATAAGTFAIIDP
jgi:acyl-CoA thioesterase